jgi:hypothetical protein
MTQLEGLHRALTVLRTQYIEDVQEITNFMLHKRQIGEFDSTQDAESELEQLVLRTFWAHDNHGAILLYLSSNRNVADVCIKASEVDREEFVTQRALLALQADVCTQLWGRGWTSIGEEFRAYKLPTGLLASIQEVLTHGFKVCDQQEADKATNEETEERRLLRALEGLQTLIK